MTIAQFLTSDVPDPEAAERFLNQLEEKHPGDLNALVKNSALCSDVQMLASCSPLFAASLLQNPEHISWLGRERSDIRVRDKQTLLESLARFSMTHSQSEPHTILARFRRRELMRIFLRDIRRLATVGEITDEISNLADAILEHALRLSKQELDNRYGPPQEQDERGRSRPAKFCVVSLGKLGSKELNYSSDIDLLFIFSENGRTSGTGSRGTTSNIEYFSKLTQNTIKLVGGQGGEGSAYRVDMRLRPHGRIGPLALPLVDTVRYYTGEAAAWERQVLIRARASAGDADLFQRFYSLVEVAVFPEEQSVDVALQNVRESKQRINENLSVGDGIDIKLGPGGIREIEFIAQALQLAYGGKDRWLRVPHTLVSLDRLADRGRLTRAELTQLYDAYYFLRRLEHILQIENGLQTHFVPNDLTKRDLIARRLEMSLSVFDAELRRHMAHVARIFHRVFKIDESRSDTAALETVGEKSRDRPIIHAIKENAPRFLEFVNAHPEVIADLPSVVEQFPHRDYQAILQLAIDSASDFGGKLRALRKAWYRELIHLVVFDAVGKLELTECKHFQTKLAEASIEVALVLAKREVEGRYSVRLDSHPLAVLAMGKLGSGSVDYDSDLDLAIVFDGDAGPPVNGQDLQELHSRVVELFTNVLSSITRDGSLYRIDLRLRPHGNDGPLVISRVAMLKYFEKDAAIWELLAYVNVRAVGGDWQFASAVEEDLRFAIHARALTFDSKLLAEETRAVRDKLEKQKTRSRSNDIDIKYGPGGLLDIYFAVRFLRLLKKPFKTKGRSTAETLARLFECGLLSKASFESLRSGYVFLANLDHIIRLMFGRTYWLNLTNEPVIRSIARRLGVDRNDFPGALTQYRIAIREAYEGILK